MSGEKPRTVNEYKRWLEQEHKVEISHRTERYYESVTAKMKDDFERSDFWVQLTGNLREFDSEYRSEKGAYPLLMRLKAEVDRKPFDSFLLKTFRKNVRANDRWPEEPEGGWILPDNWYSRISDIVRTLLVVKYLDGVEYLIAKIQALCQQHGLPCRAFFEARQEGYYAGHLYTKQQFEIPRADWDTEKVDVSIEIQITTQLQEVIRRLLHKYYEERRKRLRREDAKWQWDYESDEFIANYLGHILHYVEGMIMEVRERQREEAYERGV